jgi:hypothetical protein
LAINASSHFGEIRVPWVVGERVGHRLDDMRHGVQANHVGGAVGRRFRPPDGRPGQRVDLVEAQPHLRGVVHRRQDREHADPVAYEVGRVLGDHHAFAQGRRQEGLESFQYGRVGRPRRDQLGKVHVTRRIEEMHPAEAIAQLFGQHVGQGVDAKAGGVAGEDGMVWDEGCDLAVQLLLPVNPFGDGLDDEIAVAQQFQPVAVVGGDDRLCQCLAGERGRREFPEVGDGLECDAVRVCFLCGEIEQHSVDTGIGQLRGDLRAHHAGTEYRCTPDK